MPSLSISPASCYSGNHTVINYIFRLFFLYRTNSYRKITGEIRTGQQVSLISRDGTIRKSKLKELYVFEGLGKAKVEEVSAGELCALVGLGFLKLEIL